MTSSEEMMDVLRYTKTVSRDLADYLEQCARAPLAFEGNDPLHHSSHNHIHLWLLECFAERNEWVNLAYKREFVEYILKTWKNRIKGFLPYQSQGYRMYVYTDWAPTISVVAETAMGFPYRYSLEHAVFVDDLSDILKKYEGCNWSDNFGGASGISPKTVLKSVLSNAGSIGKATANMLGLKVGALRRLIINMGLAEQVNEIRKKHKRRPADFRYELDHNHTTLFYELLLPPKFRD